MNETKLPTIIVAGDVCIDWLSIPVEPALIEESATNWQLRGGRHMYSRRGGAWLTADFTECAVGEKASVCKPEDRKQLSAIPPDELIHSMLLLASVPRQRNQDTEWVWGVREFEGFAGPADGKLIQPSPHARCDDPDVSVVVLDDAGNGFRDNEALWPEAILEDRQPVVIYKVRRPLLQGPLWERLQQAHLSRTIVLLNANELRAEGAPVSRQLSWERTVTDLLLALAHNPVWEPLQQCAHIIIPFGLEGVLHLSRANNAIAARLWYVPGLIENDLLQSAQGDMAGFASAFAAALAATIATCPPAERLSAATIAAGIERGMLATRYLLDRAFGACADKKGRRKEPVYPCAEIFNQSEFPDFCVHQVDLPRVPSRSDLAAIGKFQDWRILDAKRTRPIRELAQKIAIQGLKQAMPELPVAKFGGLVTIDRWEIESYRSIRNLIHEFRKNPKPERPLCLAVFGRPGSGKSFGVTEVAKSVAEKDAIEKFDFNLSQWEQPGDLATALHRVRDSALRGKIPLVFFDEFDSTFRGEPLGWLKYFLAPMQDGVFSDGHFTHLIGKAIFVFAGGTCATFEEFREVAKDRPVETKARDFLSRLRGRVNVFGSDPLADASILRRAMLLRSLLERKYPLLFDGKQRLRMHDSVLAAFLNVPAYHHGIRSLEALFEMSQLQAREQFDPSMLPPLEQMQLHVDGKAFMRIVQSPALLGLYLEILAESVHRHYLKHELAQAKNKAERAKIRASQSGQEWENLTEILRDSNREQAAHIPVKLDAIGCDLAPLDDSEASGDFAFEGDEVERLAIIEHERWFEERRFKQPNHPALIPWEQLSEEMQKKDSAAVRAIPNELTEAKLKIVRLKPSGRASAPARQAEESRTQATPSNDESVT